MFCFENEYKLYMVTLGISFSIYYMKLQLPFLFLRINSTISQHNKSLSLKLLIKVNRIPQLSIVYILEKPASSIIIFMVINMAKLFCLPPDTSCGMVLFDTVTTFIIFKVCTYKPRN